MCSRGAAKTRKSNVIRKKQAKQKYRPFSIVVKIEEQKTIYLTSKGRDRDLTPIASRLINSKES